MRPAYDLDKIKFATEPGTYERAVGLYESSKVTDFEDEGYGYSAVVLGTKPYKVYLSDQHYDRGSCDCYLGQNDTLCKHMVAVAIHAITGGKPLKKEDKLQVGEPSCSGRLGTLSAEELDRTKKAITDALRYIKPYNGPSRIWFAYQNSLTEGCNRLSALVSDLPVSEQTANILVNMLLRVDRKLTAGGVDDSDGTVGSFIAGVTQALQQYAALAPACAKEFRMLRNRKTCFGWEEPLLKLCPP